MNNRLENTLKQKLLKRDSRFYTGITEIKQYKPISVNCAALSKEGETFSKSISTKKELQTPTISANHIAAISIRPEIEYCYKY